MTNKKKKKHRRRYRLVWPWNNPAYIKKKQQEELYQKEYPRKKKRRRKLRLRKQVWIVLAAAVAVLLAIAIPRHIETKNLRNLGYDKATIKNIRDQNLTDIILDNSYYSDYLAQSINDGSLNTDYINYYTVVSTSDPLDSRDFLLIQRLKDKGYEQDQIENLFHNLKFWEITPLLVFDYQPIESRYIDDCTAHSDVNSQDSFTLSGDYYKPYESSKQVTSTDDSMLVNKTWYLSSGFVPSGLQEMSNYYAATGQQLGGNAVSAMQAMGDAGRESGVTFYVSSGYRSYEDQESVYNNYVIGYGSQEAADQAAARAGFSEHQTGLAMDLAASNEDPSLAFKDTAAFRWVKEHCAEYGWILRYPENKESITQYEYEPWHYRYVGTDIAEALQASGLTYDEFWQLYLAPWDDEANKPTQAILDASNYHNLTVQTVEETESPASALPSASSAS